MEQLQSSNDAQAIEIQKLKSELRILKKTFQSLTKKSKLNKSKPVKTEKLSKKKRKRSHVQETSASGSDSDLQSKSKGMSSERS